MKNSAVHIILCPVYTNAQNEIRLQVSWNASVTIHDDNSLSRRHNFSLCSTGSKRSTESPPVASVWPSITRCLSIMLPTVPGGRSQTTNSHASWKTNLVLNTRVTFYFAHNVSHQDCMVTFLLLLCNQTINYFIVSLWFIIKCCVIRWCLVFSRHAVTNWQEL